ncbi:MAG: hypothetical protein QNJ55_18775 [Xenococcus sp. MO_188.B8]|nr:hypothetical protein [Xenococcus sp. MO_188.B8]
MSNIDSILARKDEDSLIIELSDANMESITGGVLDPFAFKPQVGVQPTFQGNGAAIGGPFSVTSGSPIVQPQFAIPSQNSLLQ